MTAMLEPCPECARHVRATEVTCPFCASPLALQGREMRVAGERPMRAALLFAGATALAACGKTQAPPEPPSPPPVNTDLAPAPAYGAPPPDFLTAPQPAPTPPAPAPPPSATGRADAGKPK